MVRIKHDYYLPYPGTDYEGMYGGRYIEKERALGRKTDVRGRGRGVNRRTENKNWEGRKANTTHTQNTNPILHLRYMVAYNTIIQGGKGGREELVKFYTSKKETPRLRIISYHL